MAGKPTHATSPIRQHDGSFLVPLTQNLFSVVDAVDAKMVGRYCWQARRGTHTDYAIRTSRATGEPKSTVFMHRLILNPPRDMEVDHRDGDGLNNRRTNLRMCSHVQNSRNQRSRCGSSEYKGVSWDGNAQKWRASIKQEGRCVYLGSFGTEVSAARAYNEAAVNRFGQFACVNEMLREDEDNDVDSSVP